MTSMNLAVMSCACGQVENTSSVGKQSIEYDMCGKRYTQLVQINTLPTTSREKDSYTAHVTFPTGRSLN